MPLGSGRRDFLMRSEADPGGQSRDDSLWVKTGPRGSRGHSGEIRFGS
jgi:hypothetical protein